MPSLAGIGSAGPWRVEIDNEEDASHGYRWSITISHTTCYIQWSIDRLDALGEVIAHLTNPKSADVLYQLPMKENELAIGLIGGRLLLRANHSGMTDRTKFNWMMEVILPSSDAVELSIAIKEALNDVQAN